MKVKLFLICFCLIVFNTATSQPGGDDEDCPCADDETNYCLLSICPGSDVDSGGKNCCQFDPYKIPVNGGLKWLITGGIIISLFYIYKKGHPK